MEDRRGRNHGPVNSWDGFAVTLDLHDGPPVQAKTDKKKRSRLSDEENDVIKRVDPSLPLPNVDKRINDLQSQLIAANERTHVLESFVKEQEAWLDQERLDHAATYRELQETQRSLSEDRALHEVQVSIIPILEEQIQMAAQNADYRVDRMASMIRGEVARETIRIREEAEERVTRETNSPKFPFERVTIMNLLFSLVRPATYQPLLMKFYVLNRVLF